MNPAGLCPQRHRILKIKKIFGNSLHWIPFTQACRHPRGPVGTFLEFCGINPTTIEIHKSNEGLSAEVIRIQNLLNHNQPRFIDGKLNPRYIRIKPFKGKSFLLSAEELTKIESHLNAENTALEELLGSGFSDEERPTDKNPFDSEFPAITLGITALVGLQLQQQLSQVHTNLSLQHVHQFLLEQCSENDLRTAMGIKKIDMIHPIMQPFKTNSNSFPKELRSQSSKETYQCI